MAQNAEQISPELVREITAGYKAIPYKRLVAPLVEVVMELKPILLDTP